MGLVGTQWYRKCPFCIFNFVSVLSKAGFTWEIVSQCVYSTFRWKLASLVLGYLACMQFLCTIFEFAFHVGYFKLLTFYIWKKKKIRNIKYPLPFWQSYPFFFLSFLFYKFYILKDCRWKIICTFSVSFIFWFDFHLI